MSCHIFKYNSVSSLSTPTHICPFHEGLPQKKQGMLRITLMGGDSYCDYCSRGHSKADMWQVDFFTEELPEDPGQTELLRLPLLSFLFAQSSMQALNGALGCQQRVSQPEPMCRGAAGFSSYCHQYSLRHSQSQLPSTVISSAFWLMKVRFSFIF